MMLLLDVEVRQIDITTAFKESPRGDGAFANDVIFQAIRRAIGHRRHAPIRVCYDGITIKLPDHGGEKGYRYVGNVVNQHMIPWREIQARRPPWPVAHRPGPPTLPDFDFVILLDEIAWQALGLRERCTQCKQRQCKVGSNLCARCFTEAAIPTIHSSFV